MMNWVFYTIPSNRRIHYGICLWLVMFIIPNFLLGMHFTMLQQFINFIFYDILYYRMLLLEKRIREEEDDYKE